MNTKIVILIVAIVLIAGIFLLFKMPKLQKGASKPAGSTPIADTTTPEVTASFASLTSNNLASALEKKDFFFVNVHIPYEGEIKNTDAFIPYDKIADNLDKLPKDKNAKIVLYCRSGRMSEIAAKELTRLGYAQVSHLAGGMIDWEKNGYKIIEN